MRAIGRGLALVAGLCGAAAPLPAAAAGKAAKGADPADIPGEVGEGRLLTRDGKHIVDVPLKRTEVRVRVSGHLAEVEVVQTFANPYPHKIEAVYAFPLPTGAAVNRLELVVGDERIRALLLERAEAREKYEVARERGLIAALLEEERANLVTQSVANIEPGAEVRVRIHYVQELAYEAGGYELVFPLVAAPRFLPDDAVVAPFVAPTWLPPDARSSHEVDLAVDLEAAVPFRDLGSPSHRLVTETRTPSAAHVRIAPGDTIPNKDFVLRWTVAGEAPTAAVLAHRAPSAADDDSDDEGTFFLMVQPPKTIAPAEVAPRELVFVIDASSSMAGAPLAKAKELVRRALAGLRPDDTFQIVRFSDRASALGPAPIANKPRNVELALGWLDALAAGGGTEMIDGVRAALDFPHDPARLRIVAFVTDGYVGNEDEVLSVVGARLGPARLFSFGVGSAVNRYLLEEMATFGRGAVTVVRPDEETGPAVERFLARVATPVLTDLVVDWKGLPVKELVPAALPDLFLGQPLVLHGRYAAPGGRATIEVRGMLAGRPVTIPVEVSLPVRAEGNAAVAALWAKEWIRERSRALVRGDNGARAAEITALALRHGLLTRYTAFVAVSERLTTGGPAQLVPVPLEAPEYVGSGGHGYGGYGVSGSIVGHAYGAAGLGLIGTGAGGGGIAHGYGSGTGAGYGHGAGSLAPAKSHAAPEVTIGAPIILGSLNKYIILDAIRPHLPAVRHLYERRLATRPDLEGKVVLGLVVSPSGRVESARIATTELGDPELETALVKEAMEWKFPAAEGGGIVEVRYPFVFKRAPGAAGAPKGKPAPPDPWWDETLPLPKSVEVR